jgi:hypothetical protein
MKIRHNLYIDRELSEALEALATGPGTNKSRLVNDAVAAWLARRGAREMDDHLKLRLERISREIGTVRRDLDVLLESVSLFILHQFTATAQMPEASAAARAVGRERFEKFIVEVGRQVAGAERQLPAADQPGEGR